jgi:hypothetical protein
MIFLPPHGRGCSHSTWRLQSLPDNANITSHSIRAWSCCCRGNNVFPIATRKSCSSLVQACRKTHCASWLSHLHLARAPCLMSLASKADRHRDHVQCGDGASGHRRDSTPGCSFLEGMSHPTSNASASFLSQSIWVFGSASSLHVTKAHLPQELQPSSLYKVRTPTPHELTLKILKRR